METDLLTTISAGLQPVSLVGLFLILWRLGILSKNGKNGDVQEKEIQELKIQLGDIENNHLHTISEKLDRLIEKEIEGNKVSEKILWVLEKNGKN